MKSKKVMAIILSEIVIIVGVMAACAYHSDDSNKETEAESYATETTTESDIWSNAPAICGEVKEELESKGWEVLQLIEGWGDWETWRIYGQLAQLTEEEKNMNVFTVWGQWEGLAENSIDIVVRIVFDDESPDGRIYKVFYQSLAGRYLAADYFISGSPVEIDEILTTDDEELLEFMYSY